MNRERFFDEVRRAPFGGRLSQDQVAGMAAILDGWESQFPAGDRRWLAYALATALHETGRAMQPIEENLDYSAERLLQAFPARFTPADAARYAHRPEAIANRIYGGRLGNGDESTGEGWLYRGRGLPQLTGKANYRKASALVDVDLVHHPEAALERDVAVSVLLQGMATGLFTGRTLGRYFNPATEEWRQARRIIGVDRADLVATYGRAFDAALRSAGCA